MSVSNHKCARNFEQDLLQHFAYVKKLVVETSAKFGKYAKTKIFMSTISTNICQVAKLNCNAMNYNKSSSLC